MDATLSKNTNKKISSSEICDKHTHQFDFIPKEIDIKDKELEAAKNMNKEAKPLRLNQLEHLGTKTPYIFDMHKDLKMLLCI